MPANPEGGFERRAHTLTAIEVRADDTGTGIGFKGHAALFDSRTWIGPKKWGFFEQVSRGAFTRSIGDHDVRFLINHDPNLVLARNTSGTLRMTEDAQGLAVDADLARTSYGNDLAISLERGDISQMSFAFEVLSETWDTLENGDEVRTIDEAKLYDVSAVTYPAYDSTDASLRSVAFDVLCTRMGISTNKRARLITGLAHDDIDPDIVPILRSASRTLASLTEEQDPAETTPVPGDEDHGPAETTRGAPVSVLRLRHNLALKQFTTA